MRRLATPLLGGMLVFHRRYHGPVASAPDPAELPPTLAELRRAREELLSVARRHGASNVRVFGSVARGDSTAESDVDFLVDMEPGRSLFDLAGLWRELESVLKRRVDVISAGGLTDRDDDIRADAVPL